VKETKQEINHPPAPSTSNVPVVPPGKDDDQ
jgi:hypothetical protein